jgi:hypothetical protein
MLGSILILVVVDDMTKAYKIVYHSQDDLIRLHYLKVIYEYITPFLSTCSWRVSLTPYCSGSLWGKKRDILSENSMCTLFIEKSKWA